MSKVTWALDRRTVLFPKERARRGHLPFKNLQEFTCAGRTYSLVPTSQASSQAGLFHVPLTATIYLVLILLRDPSVRHRTQSGLGALFPRMRSPCSQGEVPFPSTRPTLPWSRVRRGCPGLYPSGHPFSIKLHHSSSVSSTRWSWGQGPVLPSPSPLPTSSASARLAALGHNPLAWQRQNLPEMGHVVAAAGGTAGVKGGLGSRRFHFRFAKRC